MAGPSAGFPFSGGKSGRRRNAVLLFPFHIFTLIHFICLITLTQMLGSEGIFVRELAGFHKTLIRSFRCQTLSLKMEQSKRKVYSLYITTSLLSPTTWDCKVPVCRRALSIFQFGSHLALLNSTPEEFIVISFRPLNQPTFLIPLAEKNSIPLRVELPMRER